MDWNACYPRDLQPERAQIDAFIDSPQWNALVAHLEGELGIRPVEEHSRCSGAPGWNLKYRKGGRSLCTVYPRSGYVTCLLSLGAQEATEAELIVQSGTEYLQTLYRQAKPLNGSRWLMVDVKDDEILQDVIRLIGLRLKPARR